MTFNLLILIIVTFNYKNAFSAVVGAKCTAENENGVCTLLKDCERAIEELNYQGKLYTKCKPLPDYIGLNPIVCCLPTKAEIEEEIPEEWKKLPISEQKCLQYARKINGNYVITLLPNAMPQNHQKCQYDAIPTIAGGTEAVEKEFPHMVLLGYAKEKDGDEEDDGEDYEWKCGGTLISEFFVLTAAHCGEVGTIILALLGILKISDYHHKEVLGATAMYDEKADRNYEYDSDHKLNDIMLVKLNESVSFNEYIIPACLPSDKFDIGEVFTANGFGATKFTNYQSNHLLKVELDHLTNCTKLGKYFDEKTQICAGSKTEFKNTCRGDSGGPLVIRHQDTDKTPCMYTIVGIVAYGNVCFPINETQSAYTRVSAYVKWIECRVWNVGCELL